MVRIKWLPLLLAVILLVSSALALGQDVVPADAHEKYAEPIPVKAIANISDQIRKNTLRDNYTMEQNPWQEAYKTYLNIEKEYLWITSSSEEYKTKRNLSLSSGDIPDIMDVNLTEYQQLLEADLLAPLGDLYEKYGTDRLKNRMAEYGEFAWEYAQGPDEAIYGIPGGGGLGNDTRGFVWIRKDWLDKLSLSAPTNHAEFMAVVEAFVTKDPDGNGQNDTYGMAMCNNLVESNASMRNWFNMFHAEYDIWVKDADGKLIYSALQPQMKEALVAMSDLYKKGWIDPEFGIKDFAAVSMDVTNGKVGIVFGRNWAPLANVLGDLIKANAEADFIVVPTNILAVDGEWAQSSIPTAVSSLVVASKNFAHPEAVVKMANLFLDLYETQYKTYGISSDGREVWHLAGFPSFQSPLKNMNNMLYAHKYMQGELTETQITPEQLQTAKNIQSYLGGDRTMWAHYRIFGQDGPNNSSEYYVEDAYNNFDHYSIASEYRGVNTPGMTDYMAMLDSIKAETFIKIIIGDSPPEAFDAFVAEWYAAGGEQITKEVNDWYAAK